MEKINKMSNVDIITELSFLDQKIELMIMKYNLLQAEITKRYPQLDTEDGFKPKKLVK